MNKSFVQLLLLHFREFFREPEILFWTMGFPILLAGILGMAFMNKDSITQPVAIAGSKQILSSPAVTAWKANLDRPFDKGALKTLNSTKIKLINLPDEAEAKQMIKQGEFTLYVTFDEGRPAYHFDPLNAEAKQLYFFLDKKQHPDQSDGRIDPLTTTGLRYIDFLIPGLIAFGIMQSCLWGIGWSLIDRRIKKMLRRMIATPLNKTVFLSSYVVTRILLSCFEILVLTLFAKFLFGISLQGSVLALLVMIISGNIGFAGIAFLVASRAKNAQVGNGLLNVVMLPMMISSGIFFSYKGFPDWLIPVVEALPLTILANAIRSIFIEGARLWQVAMPALILIIFGVVTTFIGQRIFKWT